MSNNSNTHSETLEDEEDLARFVVRGRREIQYLMRQLADRTSLVSAHPFGSQHFALISVLDAPDDEGVILDVPQDDAQLDALLRANRIICSSQLDRVKIKFELTALHQSTHLGKPALQGAMPDSMLRLQRREFFRLVTPVSDPVRCVLSLPSGEGRSTSIDARVLDISGGGLALGLPIAARSLRAGDELPDCRLHLPDSQALRLRLRVCNMFSVTQPNGTELLRTGCAFVDLSGAQENTIQRYILRIERERAARGTE